MNWLDHLILWGYLLSTVAHGWYFYKRAGSAEHFMAGGGKIPAWAAGFSVLGTFLSSVTFLTYPGLGCTQNWNTLVFALTMPLGALFAHLLFIPFYRRMGVISIFSYLERRFNLGTRLYGNACMFIAQFFRAGVALYLVCLALVTVMQLDGSGGLSTRQWTVAVIVFVGTVVTAYTLLGGIEAVIWTDVVQVILLAGGALLCVGLLIWQTPGGTGEMVSQAYDSGKLSLAGWDAKAKQSGSLFDWNLAGKTFLVTFLFGVFENLRNYNFEMVYVQRYATVSSVREARRSVWLSVWMYIGLTAVFLLIGTALNGYYSQSAELRAEVAGLNYEQIFPHYISSLPAGIRGLILVAILAAGISTVDSSYNVVSTIFFSDIYRRFFDRTDQQGQRTREQQDALDGKVLRWTTYVMGAMSIAFAVFCLDNKNILDRIWSFAGLTGSGLVGLFLIGIFLPRATARDALISLFAGTPVVVAFALWSNDFYGWNWMKDLATQWHLGVCPLSATLTLPLGVCLHFGLGLAACLAPHRSPAGAPAESSGYNLSIYGYRSMQAHGNEMAAEVASESEDLEGQVG